MLTSLNHLLVAVSLLLAGASCAAAPEQPGKSVVTSAEVDLTEPAATTTAVASTPAVKVTAAELSKAAELAAECGFEPSSDQPVYELTETKAPTFDSIVGPIQLDVAKDVSFTRLAQFMSGFVAHGAGVELIVRDGDTAGALLLLLEADFDRAPLTTTAACNPLGDTWQLHVRDRSVRLQGHDAPSSWGDLASLAERAAELRTKGTPQFITLNATPGTPVPLAAWALATVRCAAKEGGEAPPMLQLGELCEE